MSCAAYLIWPEAIGGADEYDAEDDPPSFVRPRDMWSWICAVTDSISIPTGCGPLFAFYVEGMSEADVGWTSPEAFCAAAERLGALMRQDDDCVRELIDAYLDHVNLNPDREYVIANWGDVNIDTAYRKRMLLREMEQAKAMARWAEANGKTRIAIDLTY